MLADIAEVGHSALRQDPYKSLLEEFKTGPNTFQFLASVRKIIEYKTPKQSADELDPDYIDAEKEKAKKVRLEVQKLEDEQALRRDKWAPIEEMHEEWLKQLREIMELSQETFDDLKSRFDLSAEQIQEVDLAFAERMNKIANPE